MTSGVAEATDAAKASGPARAAGTVEAADASLTRSDLSAPGIRRRRAYGVSRGFARYGKLREC